MLLLARVFRFPLHLGECGLEVLVNTPLIIWLGARPRIRTLSLKFLGEAYQILTPSSEHLALLSDFNRDLFGRHKLSDDIMRLTVWLGHSQRWKDKVMEPHFFVSWWRWLFQPSLRIDKAGQNAHCASQPHTGLAPGAEDRLSCLTAKAHHRAKRNEDLGSWQCQTSRG
jgi:hypothetical protein